MTQGFSLAMSGFGFVALVLESTSQRLYNAHQEGWGGTPAGNNHHNQLKGAEDQVGQKKILKSMNDEILSFPWSFAYILDWAVCLTAFFAHEFPSPPSGRDDQLPSHHWVPKEELGEVALFTSWTERFNATHHWYHCRKKCKISDRIQGHKRRWLTPPNAESTRREKTLIKRADLEEHMSRNINLGMKYKTF